MYLVQFLEKVVFLVGYYKIFLFFTLFIFLFTPLSNANDGVDYTYSDNNYNIYQDYSSLTRDFLTRIRSALESDNQQTKDTALSILNYMKNGYFVYIWRGELDSYNSIRGDSMVSNRLFRPRYISFLIYRNVSSTQALNNLSYQQYDGTLWNCQFYDMGSTYSYFGQFDYNTPTLQNSSGTSQNHIAIPRILISYIDESIENFLTNYNNNLSINEITSLLSSLTETNNDINNFIQDDNVNSSSYDFSDIQPFTFDYYNAGIENCFEILKNSFTSNSDPNSSVINLPLPFTNTNLTIDTNYLHNLLYNNNLQPIVIIIEAFWWYFVSKLIIYDILRLVECISSGDFLTNKTDTLVTIDML